MVIIIIIIKIISRSNETIIIIIIARLHFSTKFKQNNPQFHGLSNYVTTYNKLTTVINSIEIYRYNTFISNNT